MITALDDSKSGALMFNVGGDDAGAFFPVEVTFVGQGSMAGIVIANVTKASGGDAEFSTDPVITVNDYSVV